MRDNYFMPSITGHADFRREADMAGPVVDWLSKQGLMIKPEFALPWGISDLVAVKLRNSAVSLRLKYGQRKAIGPSSRLQILWTLPDIESGKSATIRSLQRSLNGYYSDQVLETELEQLRRDRFVVSPRTGRYQKLNGWVPLHARVVAVELKLNRVTEALNQALLNCAIATESFVALPEQLALRILKGPKSAEFRNNGVGLVCVGRTNCKVLIRPFPKLPAVDEVLQAHCVERFWRTRDSSS